MEKISLSSSSVIVDENLLRSQTSIEKCSEVLSNVSLFASQLDEAVVESFDRDMEDFRLIFRSIDNMETLVIPSISDDLNKIDNVIEELETKFQSCKKKKKKDGWSLSTIFASSASKIKEFDINRLAGQNLDDIKLTCLLHSEEELLQYLHQQNNDL